MKVASVYVRVPPKAAQSPPPSKRKNTAFSGVAPWALAVLPECFSQISETTGPRAYVLAHLPANLVMARPGSVLYYADCKVTVAGDAIDVVRGSDRLRVPPIARLYYGNGRLALLQGETGGSQLRIFQTAAGGGPLKP